jgi:hypothetical protein
MTREETQKLLLAINSIYPNFKIEDKTIAVDAWHWALEEYPAAAVKGALQIYVKTNKSGFAPSVSQLIDCMHKPQENDRLSEGEAWALVKKAIQGANYHAEENFEKLPPEIQRAIGGPSMLRQWGMTDSDEVNTVVMSNFQRTYRAILSKKEYEDKVPQQLSDLVKQLSDKVSGERYLGIED